jgi:hypothetical protein
MATILSVEAVGDYAMIVLTTLLSAAFVPLC